MNPGCVATLRAFHSVFIRDFVPDSLTATVASLALSGSALAVVAAPLVLRGYTGQIRRLMRLRQVAEPPASWYARQRAIASSQAARAGVSIPVSHDDLLQASAMRLTAIRRATWVAYAVFVIPSSAMLWTAPSPPMKDIVAFCLTVPLLATVPALVNTKPQGSKTLIFMGMVVLGVVLGVFDPEDGETTDVVTVPLLLGALYVVTAHRKLRTVVVLMAVWLTAILCGGLVAVWLASPAWLCINDGGPGEWALASGAVTLAILAFTAFAYTGREAMRGLARLTERGFLSDISLAAGAGLAFITFLLAFAISMRGPFAKWHIAIFATVWLSAAFGSYGWVLHRQSQPSAQRSLLLLRVFSKRHTTERLLDAVQTRWRYVGPVYEIAGADLARLNIDALELNKYVSSRLHEVFLFGASDHDQLAARIDRTADREGRFRVNEVFCFESAWRQTVEQLMKMSDVILLDLRGFNREHQGAGFEIELLAQSGLLSRVFVLGDAATDWADFEARIRRAGGEPGTAVRSHVTPNDTDESVLTPLMKLAAGEVTESM